MLRGRIASWFVPLIPVVVSSKATEEAKRVQNISLLLYTILVARGHERIVRQMSLARCLGNDVIAEVKY